MDSKTFHHFLPIVLFILLAISTKSSACNNSTQTYNYNDQKTTNTSSSYNTPTQTQTFRNYIKTSCNSTIYPSICYQSLSPYASKIEADPYKLCNTSLSLALKAARSASSSISKLLNSNNLTSMAQQVVRDCFGDVKDSIGQLQDSLDAMGNLDGSYDRKFEISNIQTWVSASITNENTCSDEFDEMNVNGSLRDKIRKSMLDVARKTSTALYFINHLNY